jgi:hypothetical protein
MAATIISSLLVVIQLSCVIVVGMAAGLIAAAYRGSRNGFTAIPGPVRLSCGGCPQSDDITLRVIRVK